MHADLAIAASTIGLPELRRILDGAGITHVELELRPGGGPPASSAGCPTSSALLLDAAEVLGAATVKVAPEETDQPVDLARFHAEFDALATQAGNAGTRVALEFMPMTNLATSRRAWTS